MSERWKGESPATGCDARPSAAGPDTVEERKPPQVAVSTAAPIRQDLPPGLIGDVCRFIYSAAPHPNMDIALTGAIGFLSGVCGKAFNTYTNAGLNQYLLLLASTGMGKEAMASGIDKLLAAIIKSGVPAASDFKGPVLVSSAGLLKALDKTPSIVSVIGEFGYKLKAITSPRANPNDETLKATFLDLYSKSGAGRIVDPMAYSDRDKRTAVIVAPALTLVGESVPGVVYEALNEGMVLSGLLPRFILIEAKGNRSALQESPAVSPDPDLTQRLADLCAHCLSLNHGNNVHVVPADDEARAKFREFGAWVDSQINAHNAEIQRELWNRAHLKALKLATLCAVGINPHNPVVTINETMWATNMIVGQTLSLIAKFETGDVGQEAGNETKQVRKLRAVIRDYIKAEVGKYEKCGCTYDMHRNHHFTIRYLQSRLNNLPMFKDDKAGAKNALARAIDVLKLNDEIRDILPGDMLKVYGRAPKSFAVTCENEFLRDDE
jgi:hypothetical protein